MSFPLLGFRCVLGVVQIKSATPPDVVEKRCENKQLKEKVITIMEATKSEFFHTSSKNHGDRRIGKTPMRLYLQHDCEKKIVKFPLICKLGNKL